MIDRMVSGLTAATWGVAKLILAAGSVVALFVFAKSNPDKFQEGVTVVMNAAFDLLITVCTWVSDQLGSPSAT